MKTVQKVNKTVKIEKNSTGDAVLDIRKLESILNIDLSEVKTVEYKVNPDKSIELQFYNQYGEEISLSEACKK